MINRSFFDLDNDVPEFTLITPEENNKYAPIIEEETNEQVDQTQQPNLIVLDEENELDLSGFTSVEDAPVETPVANKTNFRAMAEHLAEKYGVDLSDDEKFESADELDAFMEEKILEKKLNEKWQDQIKDLSPEKKLMFELKDVFDDEVTLKMVAEDLTEFNSLTDEDLENDREAVNFILAKKYLSLGRTNEEVKEMIEHDEALDKAVEKAKKFRGELITLYNNTIEKAKQKKQQEILDRQAAEQKQFEELIASIDNMTELGGLTINKRHRDAMKDILTKTVYVDENKKKYNSFGYKQLKHKKEIETAIALYDALGLFNIDDKGNFKPDLSKLSKLTENKIKKGLDSMIENSQTSVTVGGDNRVISLIDALESANKK